MKKEFDILNNYLVKLKINSTEDKNKLNYILEILQEIQNKYFDYEYLLKQFKYKYEKDSINRESFLNEFSNLVEEILLNKEEKYKREKEKLTKILKDFDKKLIEEVFKDL